MRSDLWYGVDTWFQSSTIGRSHHREMVELWNDNTIYSGYASFNMVLAKFMLAELNGQ